MADTPRPLAVKLDRPARILQIRWSDGITCRYPWAFLRAHCPSAGERLARDHTEADPLSILTRVPSSELVDVRLVGAYALNLAWSDGHSAGIYTWPFLLQLAEDTSVEKSAIA